MIKYIGIDIGGTNIRVGAIDENNEIIYVTKTSTLENVTTSEDLKNKIIKMVENNKGMRVDFDDGSTITYRIITSTKDSPAIDIKIITRVEGGISKQKIHFIKEENK